MLLINFSGEDVSVELEISKFENPDWDYARSPRLVLRSLKGEWTSLARTVSMQLERHGKKAKFYLLDRSCTYDGLSFLVHRENWKVLDALAIWLAIGGEETELKPSAVRVKPWMTRVEYVALAGDDVAGKLAMEYAFTAEGFFLAELALSIPSPEYGIVIAPLFDIRHMYSASTPEKHNVSATIENNGVTLLALKDDVGVALYAEGCHFERGPQLIPWTYRFGSGFREEVNGRILFKRERRKLFVPGYIVAEQAPRLKLIIAPSDKRNVLPKIYRTTSVLDIDKRETQVCEGIVERIRKLCRNEKLTNFLSARAYCLSTFKQEVDGLLAFEAAGWWFRNIWFRDAFEVLLNNFATLCDVLDEREHVRRFLLYAMSLQDSSGRIPNKLPEFATSSLDYNSVDATLLCGIASEAFALRYADEEVASATLRYVARAIEAFSRNSMGTVNGGPVLSQGLLLSCPHHSWMDSFCEVRFGEIIVRVPCRIPREWAYKLYEKHKTLEAVRRELLKPKYFLPEVNAQWIRMLGGFLTLLEETPAVVRRAYEKWRREAEEILEMAKAYYKMVFYNSSAGYLYDVVYHDLSLRDPTPSSAAVVALSLVPELFSRKELARAFELVERELVVKRTNVMLHPRKPLTFGIVAKKRGRRYYLGDEEYHGLVVWPRDVPYLARLARIVGKDTVVEELLLSSLDHEFSEGAIFYCNELFSLAEGGNPSPSGRQSNNPVPMKNQMQAWSMWCDLYLSSV